MDADLQALMLNEIREILETQFAGVQSDMARATGISLPRINGLIRGKILITNKTLSKIKGSIETSTASHDISPVKNTSRQAIYIQRRTRLNEIIYMQFGGVIKKFAEAVELAQSTAWQIANGKQNIGEKLARRIEKALLLLPGDLDAIRAIADLNQSSRTALRRERLISVIDQVFGGDLAACARHLNLAETYLHSLQTGSRAIGDSTARLIEKGCFWKLVHLTGLRRLLSRCVQSLRMVKVWKLNLLYCSHTCRKMLRTAKPAHCSIL